MMSWCRWWGTQTRRRLMIQGWFDEEAKPDAPIATLRPSLPRSESHRRGVVLPRSGGALRRKRVERDPLRVPCGAPAVTAAPSRRDEIAYRALYLQCRASQRPDGTQRMVWPVSLLIANVAEQQPTCSSFTPIRPPIYSGAKAVAGLFGSLLGSYYIPRWV